MARTIVSFHAHPDDEAILTAGSLALAAAQGHRVVLVFATRGEVGEADRSLLGAGETLGQRRVGEAEAAAAALGVARLEFLGHLDSGDDPAAAPAPSTFAAADAGEAAAPLAAILEEEGADVLTTYDPNGGYGHPDHRQVHLVGARAAALAGTPAVLEATFDRDLLTMAVQLGPSLGLELPPDVELPDVATWYTPAAEITHRIDVRAVLDRKRAAMEAHASQATSSTGPFRSMAMFLSLPDELFELAFGTEWYVDRRLGPGEQADDLFARLPERAP